jgi:mono/diheme cytochrome c family protein
MRADNDLVVSILSFLFITLAGQGQTLAANTDITAEDIIRMDDARDIYQTNCAACHGFDGIPMMPGIPNFSAGDRLEKPDQELFASVQNGKEPESGGVPMPPWQGTLSEEEILTVLNYIRVIKGDLVFQDVCMSCHGATVPAMAESIPQAMDNLKQHEGPFNLCKGTDTDNMIEREDIISVIQFLAGVPKK